MEPELDRTTTDFSFRKTMQLKANQIGSFSSGPSMHALPTSKVCIHTSNYVHYLFKIPFLLIKSPKIAPKWDRVGGFSLSHWEGGTEGLNSIFKGGVYPVLICDQVVYSRTLALAEKKKERGVSR